MPSAFGRPPADEPPAIADPMLLAGYVAGAHWRRAFGPAAYREAIRRGNEEPIPRPLALILRMPPEPYPRPDANDPRDPDAWLPCLEREIELHAASVAPDRRLARLMIEDPDLRLDPARRRHLVDLALRRLPGVPRASVVPFRLLDAIGAGPGAVGRVEHSIVRNLEDPIAYCEAIARGELPIAVGCWLGRAELARGDLVATLVEDGHVDLERLSAEQGFDVAARLAAEISALPPTHVARDGARLELTPAGRAEPDIALAPLLTPRPASGSSPVDAWRREPAAGR